MPKVALIVIYNHQFNDNIPTVEKIYKHRFSKIFHLVPFYTGNRENVIPIYESSYFFQGYIAQGFKTFHSNEYEHYFFIADDLYLNPLINEDNYKIHLKIDAASCFLPEFVLLHDKYDHWPRIAEAAVWSINASPGVEAQMFLPSYSDAISIFNSFGLEIKPIKYKQMWRNGIIKWQILKIWLQNPRRTFNILKAMFKGHRLEYPLIGSYSDICVIDSSSINLFSQYCGVFAATRLFVELAIPTAVVLSAQKIVKETDLQLRGHACWTNKEKAEIEDRFERSLQKLCHEFPQKYMYLHPIKLSRWRQ